MTDVLFYVALDLVNPAPAMIVGGLAGLAALAAVIRFTVWIDEGR